MNILFTICGRAGSKGIKNKNISNFLGKPLVYYTLSALDLYMKHFGEGKQMDVVLNTDSEELIRLVDENPFMKVEIIRRQENLGGDLVPKKAVILDSYRKMCERRGIPYEVIVDLDITSPLRTKDDIAALMDKHLESKSDITFSVTDARRNPYFNMVMRTEEGIKGVIHSNFVARQQAPEVFDMNASMYAYTPEFLKSDKDVLDGQCEIIKMQDTAVLDLDNERDFELMEILGKFFYEKNPLFGEVRENIIRNSGHEMKIL